jgi:hypothetical protein
MVTYPSIVIHPISPNMMLLNWIIQRTENKLRWPATLKLENTGKKHKSGTGNWPYIPNREMVKWQMVRMISTWAHQPRPVWSKDHLWVVHTAIGSDMSGKTWTLAAILQGRARWIADAPSFSFSLLTRYFVFQSSFRKLTEDFNYSKIQRKSTWIPKKSF